MYPYVSLMSLTVQTFRRIWVCGLTLQYITKNRLTQMSTLREAKGNKIQIQQHFQNISNIQVFSIMVGEIKWESSPHSLLKKVKNISKTAQCSVLWVQPVTSKLKKRKSILLYYFPTVLGREHHRCMKSGEPTLNFFKHLPHYMITSREQRPKLTLKALELYIIIIILFGLKTDSNKYFLSFSCSGGRSFQDLKSVICRVLVGI